jgi:hypothetical protein
MNIQPSDSTGSSDDAPACSRPVGAGLSAGATRGADAESMIAALQQFEPGTVFERDQPAMQEAFSNPGMSLKRARSDAVRWSG